MQKKGLKILDVATGSVAEEIGLVPGDRILAVNGRAKCAGCAVPVFGVDVLSSIFHKTLKSTQ